MCDKLCIKQKLRFNLLYAKCRFAVLSGIMQSHMISKKVITMDLGKVKTIFDAPTPQNAKKLAIFHGQYGGTIGHCDTMPLQTSMHWNQITWTEKENKAYMELKLLLSQALAVEPLDWYKKLRVFMDALNILIESILMQTYDLS